MQSEWLDFIAAIAWPLVGLLALLIAGPFGLLEKLVKNLSSITTSVDDFKKQVVDLKQSESRINEIAGSLHSLKQQLDEVHSRLGTVQSFTTDLLQESLKSESEADSEDLALSSTQLPNPTVGHAVDEASMRYTNMEEQWSALCEILKSRIGADNFDGRSIAYMAQRLGHKNRKDNISKEDAELIGQLSAKMKRFRRLQSTKSDWLDESVYQGFTQSVAKIIQSLRT
jgi:hypothetical protein